MGIASELLSRPSATLSAPIGHGRERPDRIALRDGTSTLECVGNLPRNAIGKVLKRDLRDRWIGKAA